MSRCFPFPPPGYERKGRIDDVDLLKKEKDKEKKEKKEKKDKKDKEKKEKKEKREKDNSDGKYRDKKDKKEKHRDKEKKRDKEKDKDKAKDKSSASDEKRLSGQIESRGGEKSFQKEVKDRDSIVDKKFAGKSGGSIKGEKPGQISHPVDANKDSKLVQELGRRIKDDSRGTGTQFENFAAPDHKKDEGMVRLVAKGTGILAEAKEKEKRASEKKMDGQGIRDGARSGGNATVHSGAGIVQTKVEGIRDGARSGGNATIQSGAGTVQTKIEGIRDGGRSGGNATVQSTAGTVQTKVEGIRDRARSGTATVQSTAGTVQTKVEGIRDGSRSGGNAMFQSTAGMVQTKVEGLPRPMDKSVDRKMEGKEKAKEKGSDDKRASKSKEKDREKKSHGKDKDRDKERKKEEKAKEKSQLKKAESDKLRGSNNDIVSNHAIKTPIPKDSKTSAVPDGNPKKRKDFETNGVGHAFDGLPSKLPRPTISSHPTKENGRIVEHCPTSVLNASDREEEAPNNLKIDNKEHKLNGKIEAQTMPVTPAKHKSVTAQVDPFAEAAARPPHSDSKYLSQIYSVPKMPELPDYDDQEWLFSSKKPRVESSPAEEPSQVWAEAQPIESADIIALPYVIPY